MDFILDQLLCIADYLGNKDVLAPSRFISNTSGFFSPPSRAGGFPDRPQLQIPISINYNIQMMSWVLPQPLRGDTFIFLACEHIAPFCQPPTNCATRAMAANFLFIWKRNKKCDFLYYCSPLNIILVLLVLSIKASIKIEFCWKVKNVFMGKF